MSRPERTWSDVVSLVERVMAEENLLAAMVDGVRSRIREVAPLAPADVAGHTRALLSAATRSLAARRPPTEAELAFVAELAVARARQGVQVEAVLAAVHVAGQLVWSRARDLAPALGVTTEQLLDARELYDDWAEAVRHRLIAAHRAERESRLPEQGDRALALLRRMLAGGSAAALAAAEARLPTGRRSLWLAVCRPGEAGHTARLESALRPGRPFLLGIVDEMLVGVSGGAPAADRTGFPVGIAGPADPEELAETRRLALGALTAAEALDHPGGLHIADQPTVAAILDRPDLGQALAERYAAAAARLGRSRARVAATVLVWLRADRDVRVAAARLFVHPNTVRNRVHRFTEVTGLDPLSTFTATDAWWLCHQWVEDTAG